MHTWIIIAGWLLALAACGDAGSTLDNTIGIFLDADSTQCQKDGAGLEEMHSQLVEADITVANARCGSDGKMFTAMYGSPDGKIGIFDIDPSDLPTARALGFEALASLHEATTVPCSQW